MYSPINYSKNYILPDYVINSNKSQKNNAVKTKSNSLNSKKLILSRNENNYIKDFIMKTKTNNTNIYKPTDNIDNTQYQMSYENKSINHHQKKEKILNPDTLFNFISSKMKGNKNNLNQRHNNNTNNKINSTKLDFNMSYIKKLNKQKNEEKNNFNKYNGTNNSTNKNIYKKILNFPLSPGNKSMKVIKLNSLNMNEVANSFNNINKEKDIINKRILSSHNLLKNKTNDNKNKINSFIYNNTNNINLNVNIINKEIFLNNINSMDESRNGNSLLLYNNKYFPKTNKNINTKKNKKTYFSNNQNIINNKENIFTPEEIHFQAVIYMQKIKIVGSKYM